MILQVPIKSAKYFGWQHVLKDLGDFQKCISQRFGESPDYYAWLNIDGHNGLDIPYDDGTEVFASHDGTVEFVGQDSSAGKGVVIKAQGYKTIYWHLKEFRVKIGDRVKMGDLIGLGDNTGFSTAPHLHFGLKLLDDNGQVLNRDNGFDGAIDPLPFITWFVQDMTTEQVHKLYASWHLNDPQGEAYWVGKPLDALLKARLEDGIKTFTEALS